MALFFVYAFAPVAVCCAVLQRRRWWRDSPPASAGRGSCSRRRWWRSVSPRYLALAELKYGFTWEEVKREGVDIVVALDVSDSMLVEDAEAGGKLSRLETRQAGDRRPAAHLEGDRIGLVAFAGTAFLECPLTLDYGAAELFLCSIDTDLIPVKGTALGDGAAHLARGVRGRQPPSQAIILITDGEDHGGDALAAAEEAKLAGVRIFAIGIGRDEGRPIPAAGGGFRRDRRGEMVLSRLDESTLQRIALTPAGRYVRSVTGDVDLEQIYSQGIKAVLEDQELGSQAPSALGGALPVVCCHCSRAADDRASDSSATTSRSQRRCLASSQSLV